MCTPGAYRSFNSLCTCIYLFVCFNVVCIQMYWCGCFIDVIMLLAHRFEIPSADGHMCFRCLRTRMRMRLIQELQAMKARPGPNPEQTLACGQGATLQVCGLVCSNVTVSMTRRSTAVVSWSVHISVVVRLLTPYSLLAIQIT